MGGFGAQCEGAAPASISRAFEARMYFRRFARRLLTEGCVVVLRLFLDDLAIADSFLGITPPRASWLKAMSDSTKDLR